MPYSKRRGSSGYRSRGYASRGRASARSGARSDYGRRRAPARGGRRSSGGRGGQTLRLEIVQAPANPVSRANLGLMNTLLRTATPPSKRSKL